MPPQLSRRATFSLAWAGSLLVTAAAVGLFHQGYGGGVLGRLTLESLSVVTRARPRFVQAQPIRSIGVSLASGFYEHKVTKIVHYVTPDKTIRHVSRIDETKLKAVAFAPDMVGRLHPATAGQVVEVAVLGILKKEKGEEKKEKEDKIEQSLRVLRNFITLQQEEPWRYTRSGRPSFRLYDLLAGVAVRYERQEDKRRVVELAKAAMERGADKVTSKRLSQRLAAWSDASSDWHKKWADASRPVTWRLPVGTDRSTGRPKPRYEAVEFVDGEVRSI